MFRPETTWWLSIFNSTSVQARAGARGTANSHAAAKMGRQGSRERFMGSSGIYDDSIPDGTRSE
jgi:hypothetical protein